MLQRCCVSREDNSTGQPGLLTSGCADLVAHAGWDVILGVLVHVELHLLAQGADTVLETISHHDKSDKTDMCGRINP